MSQSKTEFWWVCEDAASTTAAPAYWCGGNSFTQNPHERLIKKYSTKDEANEGAKDAPRACRIAEHGWTSNAE